MKKFSKLIGFIVVFMVMMVTMCTVSFAATVGEQLTSPDDGWQRIDDNDTRIKYIGSDAIIEKKSLLGYMYNDSQHWCYNDSKAKFVFNGTKLRLISYADTFDYSSKSVSIIIDGNTYTYTGYGYNAYQVIVAEVTGLRSGNHSVVIYNTDPNSSIRFGIDAIDIDDNGYLVDANQPTNLTATAGNIKVDLSWTAVEGVTNFNIYRSETSGYGYTKIGSTTSEAITSYVDSTVKKGTTYYYVVTAVNASGESLYSNEVSATPQASNQLKLVLEVNETKLMSISNELSDNSEMDWSSSDSAIATVDENGKAKALKPGNIVITCTSKDKSYTESINVLVVDLEYQLAVDLSIGDKCRLTVDDLANATNVTWSSYDSTIATVTAKGKVTAISEGLTYIVACDKDGKEIGRIYIRVRK